MSINDLEAAQNSLRDSLRDVRKSMLDLKQMLDDPHLPLTERHAIERQLLSLMETNKSGEEQLAQGHATLEQARNVPPADTDTENLVAVVVVFCLLAVVLVFFLW